MAQVVVSYDKILNFFKKLFLKRSVNSNYTGLLGKLDSIYAEDIMVERSKILALSISATKKEVLAAINSDRHSRIPVYDGDLDKILGFIHIKDVVENLENDFKISNIIRRVIFIPPAMKISAVLFRMKSYHIHAAVVVDEFGATVGLVTMTDIVEEILGDIDDEHDNDVDPAFVKISENRFEVSARLELKDFVKRSGIKIEESEHFRTIGGYILSLTGKVPLPKEKVIAPSGIEFIVLDADSKRINIVVIDASNHLKQ